MHTLVALLLGGFGRAFEALVAGLVAVEAHDGVLPRAFGGLVARVAACWWLVAES